MEELIVALLRKVLVMVLFFGGWIAFDKFYLATFDTVEVLKGDPKAVALLLGLMSVAFSLA